MRQEKKEQVIERCFGINEPADKLVHSISQQQCQQKDYKNCKISQMY